MTREEAVEVLKERYLTCVGIGLDNHANRVNEALDMAIEALSAEAVQGEWIHDGQNFKGGIDWCHCSECGKKTSTNGLDMYKFCPNCGADMRGEEE